MGQLTISEVARQVGLRASAIRYYEQLGILPRAHRISGQRRYEITTLYRLAVVQRARKLGFTLEEIRRLFFGFRKNISASERWQKLSRQKLVELETQISQIKTMQDLLTRMQGCKCDALDQCGRGIFRSDFARAATESTNSPKTTC